MSDNTDARRGDWMQTYSGRRFWPLSPRPEDIHLVDIAHSLAHQCRFAGHVRQHYSVAEHSVRVSWLAGHDDVELAMAALLHDAAEAYVVDVPRPFKRHLVGYADIEAAVEECVERRFDLESGIIRHPSIKHWDEMLLATEARDLMGGESAGKWALRAEPLPTVIAPMPTYAARALFLERFAELQARRGAAGAR